MTPCVIHDGDDAFSDDKVCVGCGYVPSSMGEVRRLRREVENLSRSTQEPDASPEPKVSEMTDLLHFAGRALKDRLGGDGYAGDWDGGDIKDALFAAGLLEKVTASQACEEPCICAETGGFPTDCIRLTKLGEMARKSVGPQAPDAR